MKEAMSRNQRPSEAITASPREFHEASEVVPSPAADAS